MSERLTNEQLRELDERLRRAGPGEAIRVSSEELNAIRRGDVMFPNLTDAAELLALRVRVAKLEAGGEPNSYEARMDAYGKKIDELRARVAQLETALTNIAVNAPDGWEGAIARAALKDTPGG